MACAKFRNLVGIDISQLLDYVKKLDSETVGIPASTRLNLLATCFVKISYSVHIPETATFLNR